MGNLLPGRYDLLVRPSSPYAETWERGVEAGGRKITVHLREERTAAVTAEVLAERADPEQLILLRWRLDPHGAPPDAPALPPAATYDRPGGWPAGVLGMWYGSGGDLTDHGQATYSLSRLNENPTTLRLDEGFYRFGAKGKDRDGNFLFPIGTGLVHIGPGNHRLRFELVPAFPLEGRVHAPDALDLAVAIASDDGGLLELDVGARELRPLRELGADGYFRFALVPTGTHELRVGTPDELLAGAARHRQPLVVGPDGVPFQDVTPGG